MIKFKKMSTFAKVASIGGVTAVVGVAFIPVINKFIDNPKSKVHVYEFNNRLFKTKEAAEKARMKFTAMSGLISAMNSDKTMDPNTDYKPLMAEFVSFVSKLFAIKVFQMDGDSATTDHFKYDGMSKSDKQDLLEKEIAGQIQYGDLKDITSLVKYATAKKNGQGENDWMFTPVDELLLSILGDGSGQGYSMSEIHYSELSRDMDKLKAIYEAQYEKFKDSPKEIDNLAYSLVHGLVHHVDPSLEMADRQEDNDPSAKEGDFSGDEYSKDLIEKYIQWGTLKASLEDSKIDLDSFVSTNNITPAMKPILLKLIADNAVAGWNNGERYSKEEIELRDLLAKVASQTKVLNGQVIPGAHTDTNTNIVEGWNWSPTGDESDKKYEDWQLELAKNIQYRQRLLSMHISPAPAMAELGLNAAPTGDGSGNEYKPELFQLKNDLEAASARIDELNTQINFAVSASTKPAPDNGVLSASGKHEDAIGKGDGVDYTGTFETVNQLKALQQAVKDAQQAKQQLEEAIGKATVDTNPDVAGGDEHEATLLALLDFDVVKQGWNWNKNYNEDEVNYAKALDKKADLEQQIAQLEGNGIKAAPEGAVTNNLPPKGIEDDKTYAQEQIDLRDYKDQLATLGATLDQAKHDKIQRAPTNGIQNPIQADLHEDAWGMANGETYSSEFINAARRYRSYLAKIQSVQDELKDIETKFPGRITKSPSHTKFEDLYKNHAVEGPNTKEQFSTAEVKYATDQATLVGLQTTFSDATKALATFRAAVTSEKYAQKLRDDFKDHKTPTLDENEKPSGDRTGNHYSSDDKKFYEAYKMLKDNFPEGNPWWTKTSDQKSDEAYYALYDDWKTAIADHAGTDNTAKVGDGTDNQYDGDQFKTFDRFFRKAIQELHGSDTARAQKVSDDFDTILKYIQDHGSLYITNGDVKLSETDAAPDDKSRETGDGSGHKYLPMHDVWVNWYYSYGSNRDQGAIDRAQTALNGLNTAIADGSATRDAQAEIDKYKGKIADRQKEIDRLEGVYNKAQTDYQTALTEYQNQGTEADRLKRAGALAGTKFGETELKEMAALDEKDNQAVAPTQDAADKLAELKQIESDLKDAKSELKAKKRAVTKMQDDQRDFFLRYQGLGKDLPVTGKNYIGNGDESGDSYSFDQIDGRDFTEKITEEIKKHPGVSVSAELAKLMNLKQNSVVGPNTNKASGHSVGDTSGTTWYAWEIDLRTTVFSLIEIHDRLKGTPYAPIGAEQGLNAAPTGDKSGNTYKDDDEFITKFMPAYKKLLDEQQTAQDSVDALATKKQNIDKLGLNSNTQKDPHNYYVTKSGKVYTQDQIKAAIIWKAAHDLKNTKEGVEKTADGVQKAAKKAWDDAKRDTHDLNSWNSKISDAQKILDKYTPEKVAAAQETLGDAKAAMDKHKDYVKTWWDSHKAQYLDTTDGGALIDYHVSGKFTDFIGTTQTENAGVRETTSVNDLYKKLSSMGADLRGHTNVKSSGKHTQEELDLRDALIDVIDLKSDPTVDYGITDTAKYRYIFNTLIMMYGKAVEDGFQTREDVATTGHTLTGRSITLKDKTGKSVDGKFYSGVSYINHSATAMVSFKNWITLNLKADTEQRNKEQKGDGTGKKYNSHFFSNNGKVVDTVAKLDAHDFKLGQAAFTVKIFHTNPHRMTSHSIEGDNSMGSGDESGNTYTQADLDYLNAYAAAQAAKKAVDDQNDKIAKDLPTDGTILKKVPVGYKGSGTTKHELPIGDGTGNVYTLEEITAAKRYFALESELVDDRKLITDLQQEWADEKLTDKRSWDEVKTITAVAKVGLNHDTWWSAAEKKYDGDNVRDADLLAKIAALESGTITDPNYVGTGTAPKIKIEPAPKGAVVGLNNSLKGLGDKSIYLIKQIEKRDNLKLLYKDLSDENAKIAAFIAKKTTPAPRADIVPVDMAHWHPETIGDGSNKFYSSKIFQGRTDRLGADFALAQTQAALDEFINGKDGIGQAAIDQMLKEIKDGAVNGVNYEEQYSIDEIAYRDNMAKLGTEQDHLKLLKGSPLYSRIRLLQETSIPGLNIMKKGIGDNRDYSQKEIDLRELDTLIKSQETLHGIKSEEDLVSYYDLFTEKTVDTQIKVRDYYNEIDLSKATVGENHASHGDESNALYTTTDINTFNSIVDLQNAIAKNKDRIKELQDKNVVPAPKDEKVISALDVNADPKDYDKHKDLVGDGSGNKYEQSYLDMAQEYKDKLDAYNFAKSKFDAFVNADKDLIRFFEIKTAPDPLTGIPHEWNPIAGRNWTKDQFELKALYDKREALGVDRTMVDSVDGKISQFGTNRGHMGEDATGGDHVVIYQGSSSPSKIKDEVLGSDKARIGYVLKIGGKVTEESPVLDSLEDVAKYIQEHQDLAPEGLIRRFALLQNMGISDTDDIYKITDEQVSKDRFNAMAENYEWGDK